MANTRTYGNSTKIGAMWKGEGRLQTMAGMPQAKVKLVKADKQTRDGQDYFILQSVFESGKTWNLCNMFYNKDNKEIIEGTIDNKDNTGMTVKIIKSKPEYVKNEDSPTSIIYGTTFVVSEIKEPSTPTVKEPVIVEEEEEEECPF
jgi:hypothetical protein